MKKDLILFGVQGSGKGTQARLISEKFGIKVFETGAELRKIKNEDSELGHLVRGLIEAGNLVPNEIVMQIVGQFLESVSAEEAVIFDGLPRSMEQKTSFDELLAEKNRDAIGLQLELDREEAIRRMLLRGRSDDTPEAIETRLKHYYEKTNPVIESYEAEGKMIRIDGNQPIEKVTLAIYEALISEGC